MSTVFISYRRQTAAGEARALFNDLTARLGENAVFMDVDSIPLGRDFRGELQKTLAACDLMLVIIDKDWAAAKDERGRVRLENTGDFVRMEIEAALKRDIVVTPILVKGAQMPAAEELPAEIRDLAYRSGFELSHNRWESDVREMIRRLNLGSNEQIGEVETGRAVLKEDWPKKRQGEEICAGYIDEWARRCDLDGWTGWSSFVLGGDNPQMTVARDHELEELGPWLLGRVWPARYPTVERAFANFRVVLQDLQNTFRKHAEKPTPDNDWLLTVKFYQFKEWDEERYKRLGKAYSFHVALVQDLMLELTRAANFIADEVRSSIIPTFRHTQGGIMVESGPHLPNGSWRTFAVHYSPEEKGQLMPYPGLEAFKQARFARDKWFGDPNSKY
jgi:TIR domain